MKKLLAKGLVIFTMLLIIATPVLANSSNYEFTMDYRYVNGKDNGITHNLDAGTLINSGEIWNYDSLVGAVGPYPVTIEVWKDEIFDNLICSTEVTPSTTHNERTSYYVNGGSVPDGVYYIVAWKTEDDGWDDKAEGTLTTR